MIGALYVCPRGPYSELTGVELWDESRDARGYLGPHPVVAHPPCARWGRFARGCPRNPVLTPGDDGGCFLAALAAVRRWGGVLEHPAHSHAWAAHGLAHPVRGGWMRAGLDDPGWTCAVDQGHYGHEAPKATWLYAVGTALPSLVWTVSHARGRIEFMCRGKRNRTPRAFRDLLVGMARTACDGVGP